MDWRLKQGDPKLAAHLAGELDIPDVLARMLASREWTEIESTRAFLNPALSDLPDPFLLTDMDKAVERLILAIDRKEKVTVYGDYDADGLTATALLADVLESLDVRVNTYIPHRIEEGYGLSFGAVESLAASGTTLIVTVDCGVADLEAVNRARELGVDVIVTDHHQLPARLPAALAIVNPMRSRGEFPQRQLAGVGVAFFLAGGLRQALRRRGVLTRARQPELAPLLGLVAIGTVADVAPLTKVNRVLVRIGLAHLADPDRPGLSALKALGAIEPGRPPSARDVAFRLAPRLNAAGRLGPADPGLEVLRTRDADRARSCAEELERLNRERRRLQEKLLRQAEAQLEAGGGPRGGTIVLAGEGWPRGLVGLVASKMADQYRRPTILLAIEGDLASGSGRSIKGFNLFAALTHCRDLMIRFGGHEQAAGLTLDRERVGDLVSAFEKVFTEQMPEEERRAVLDVDAFVSLADLDQDLTAALARMAPFGAGNPDPVFVLSGLNVLSAGAVGVGAGHLRLTLAQDGRRIDTIGFGLGDRLPELGRIVSVAVQEHTSTRGGRIVNGWKIVDIKNGPVGPDHSA